ncbi:MAG: hypothetical protein ACQEUN_09800 [Pseudomonadota bacterium]
MAIEYHARNYRVASNASPSSVSTPLISSSIALSMVVAWQRPHQTRLWKIDRPASRCADAGKRTAHFMKTSRQLGQSRHFDAGTMKFSSILMVVMAQKADVSLIQ